jgi:hypothetical protein
MLREKQVSILTNHRKIWEIVRAQEVDLCTVISICEEQSQCIESDSQVVSGWAYPDIGTRQETAGHGPYHLCKKMVGSAGGNRSGNSLYPVSVKNIRIRSPETFRKRQPYTATFSCGKIWWEISRKRKQEPVVDTVAWNSAEFYPIRPFPAVRHSPGQWLKHGKLLAH